MSAILRDIRYVLRSLRQHLSLVLVMVLTLSIAMGATVAIFSFVNTLLLRPLPFPDAERLVALWDSNRDQGLNKARVSSANFQAWSEQNDVFEHLALFSYQNFLLTGRDEPLQLFGSRVTEDFFPLLGVEPAVGRLLQQADFDPAAPRVAVLSYALWQNRFSGDRSVLDRTLTLDGQSVQVVGVMPRQILPLVAMPAGRVRFSAADEHLWLAFVPFEANHSHVNGVLGRLRQGVGLDQASSRMQAVAQGLAEQAPDTNRGFTVVQVPLVEEAVGDIAPTLWLLFGAVALMLLIACVNVVNLLLVRTLARDRELALRVALGAGRGVILRLFLVEAALVVLASAVIGVLLSFWGIRAFSRLIALDVPRLNEVGVGSGGFLLIGGLVVLISLAFAIVPLLQIRWKELEAAFREGGRSGASVRTAFFRRGLVVGQMALAVMLVVGSALLVRSFQQMQQVDPGFRHSSVLVLKLLHPLEQYPERFNLTNFYDQVQREVGSLPGVEAVAAGYDHPLSANWFQGFLIEGQPVSDSSQVPVALFRTVTPSYFDTVGLRIAEGRGFDANQPVTPGVAVVNKALVDRYLPDGRAIGQRFATSTTQWRWGDDIPSEFEIIGVVDNVRFAGPEEDSEPAFYVPYAQTPQHDMNLLVRTAGDPLAQQPAVRAVLRRLAPQLPVVGVTTVQAELDETVAGARFSAVLLATFGLVSLVLAVVGLWGVVSNTVLQRSREVAVRMALGADKGGIIKLLTWHGLKPVILGVVVGLVGAFLLRGFLSSLLFGISALDPVSFVLVPLVLLLVSLVACLLPARKATHIQPFSVLRTE